MSGREAVATNAAPHVRTVGQIPLLLGFLTGPIVWSLHLVISELLISASCAPGPAGFASFTIFGAAGWRVVLLIVTGVLALIILGADLVALRAWRQTGIGLRLTGDAGGAAGRSGWMAPAGVLVSTLFLIATLMAGVPIFWLSGCT